jgi:hypothetical protein
MTKDGGRQSSHRLPVVLHQDFDNCRYCPKTISDINLTRMSTFKIISDLTVAAPAHPPKGMEFSGPSNGLTPVHGSMGAFTPFATGAPTERTLIGFPAPDPKVKHWGMKHVRSYSGTRMPLPAPIRAHEPINILLDFFDA